MEDSFTVSISMRDRIDGKPGNVAADHPFNFYMYSASNLCCEVRGLWVGLFGIGSSHMVRFGLLL